MRNLLSLSLFVALISSPLASSAQEPAAAKPAGRPLDFLIQGPNVWEITEENFQKEMAAARFAWLSERHDQARFFGAGLSLWEGAVKLNEAIIEFGPEKTLSRQTFSIFSRGDSGVLPGNRDQFEKQINSIRDTITQRLGVPFTERGKDKTSAVAAEGFLWTKAPSAYLLEYSYQREMKSRGIEFRPEFIRLRVAPIPKPPAIGAATSTRPGSATVAKSSLTGNLKREENGDVYIATMPMVDQGPKGYCAVATAERVFRYYGIPVDQHEMAQVAGTGTGEDGGGGTSPTKMYEALKKLEGRLHVRVRVIEDWEFKKFSAMVGNYNKEAKRAGKSEVSAEPRNGTIYIDEIYGAMDGQILKTARTERDRSGYGKFQRSLTGLIDQGVPIMWGVILGLLPEPEIPQANGGHMRLIIGYNSKTGEILYSDSWGAKHALKRMPFTSAYTMTTGLYYMEPIAR